MSNNLKTLISKRNKGFVALLNSGQANFTRYQNQCQKCLLKPLKPHRSYHCRTCDRDIIFMDHHSIFFNNCIGLNNFRYFLGFILYLSMILPILLYSYSLRNFNLDYTLDFLFFNFLRIFDVILYIVILPLTVWYWNLALTGKTSIEHVKGFFKEESDE